MGETTSRSTPSRSQPTAAPTMSAIESTAPTSWKWTFSIVVPCTLASTSASRWKIRRRSLLLAGREPAAVDHGLDVVQVPVLVFRLVLDRDLGRAEAVFLDLLGEQLHARQAERADGLVESLQRHARIDQRAEGHVSADAAGAIEISDTHGEILLEEDAENGRLYAARAGKS